MQYLLNILFKKSDYITIGPYYVISVKRILCATMKILIVSFKYNKDMFNIFIYLLAIQTHPPYILW